MSVESVLSTQTHTHTHLYRSILTMKNLIYTQFKMGSKQSLEMDEDSSTEQKTWQVYSFGKRNVLRFVLNESREGFCWRGRGRSFHGVPGFAVGQTLDQ